MARARRSPPEKKQLSLARDRPLLAKNPKAFRKNWPKKKQAVQGAFRTAQRDAIASGDDPASVSRRELRKWGPSPLGEVVADKLTQRDKLRANPRKSSEARARRAARRGRRKVA
jgi:hypothetical protein